MAGKCCLPAFLNNLVFFLRLLRNFCAFCVRPRIPSAPKQSKAAKTPTSSPNAPSQPFMPCKPHKHWFKAFSNNFGIYFCDFCVTFAPFAFAPVFPLRPLRSPPYFLCALCVRPRIHSSPNKAKPQKHRQPAPMRLPSHLCPATRINTGSSLFQTNLVFPFATSA